MVILWTFFTFLMNIPCLHSNCIIVQMSYTNYVSFAFKSFYIQIHNSISKSLHIYCNLYVWVLCKDLLYSSKFEKLEFFESVLDIGSSMSNTTHTIYNNVIFWIFFIYIVKNSVISLAILVQAALDLRPACSRTAGHPAIKPLSEINIWGKCHYQ